MEEDYLNDNTENIFTRNNEGAKRDFLLLTQFSLTENEKIEKKEEKVNDVDFLHAKSGALENENNENEEIKKQGNNENEIDIENIANKIKENNENIEKNEEYPKYEQKINNLIPFIIVSFSEKPELDRIKVNIRFKNSKNIINEIVTKSINDYKKRRLFNNEFEIDFISIKKVKK